jgi:flagellar biosynthetic protein FlhB
MPEQPAAERTEQPTPRRLEKAREKGQVPQSAELPSAATLMALLLILALLAPNLLRWFIVKTKQGLSGQTGVFADSEIFARFFSGKIVESMAVICPIVVALAAASILACVAISGLNFSTQAINLKWNAINPVSGFRRLTNARSLVRLIISVAKLLLVSIIVWLYLRNELETLASLRWAWSSQFIGAVAKMIFALCVRVGIALIVIAIADAFYQKWKHIRELRMTRQEVKRERKDDEVSPELKARIRRIQIQMSTSRLRQEVPKANVILVNPTHVAVALRYEAETMDAPVLVAKGADYLADKIREIGQAYGVPIVRRPELARTIYSTVQPGSAIPQTLYVAVAEVLAMIYRLRRKKSNVRN